MIGRTISHYRILEKLGAGGMGEVYLAEDANLKRKVALKVLSAEMVADATSRARLVREARVASSLDHPHICTIYEVGEADGHTYIAMELARARSLREQIPPDGLPLETALRYGVQVADALSHAHEHHVVHRDLKSANVVVTEDGRAKVLDFGLATRSTAGTGDETMTRETTLTESGSIVGTPSYLAPEVLRGVPANEGSDIWSLGVLLYEMAAGYLPFQGRGSHELGAAILKDPPAQMPPRVSAAFRSVIQRCLEKEPARRYRRASEVRAALETLQSDLRAPAGDRPSRARLRLRRTVTLTLLVALAAAAAWFAWRRIQPTPDLKQRQLTATFFPDPGEFGPVSPDGRNVALARDAVLHVRGVDSGESAPVTLPEGFRFNPAFPIVQWFPDGTQLLASGVMADSTRCVWVIPTVGGRPHKIRSDGNMATVSPDGSRIAYIRMGTDGPEIWCAGANGEDPRRIASSDSSGAIGSWVAWSPNGRRLAYVRHNTYESRGLVTHLESCDLEGHRRLILSDTPEQSMHYYTLPLWLPDGRLLFGLTDPPPNQSEMNLWSLRVDPRSGAPEGKPRRITQWQRIMLLAPFGVSRDGRRLTVGVLKYQSDCYVGRVASGDSMLQDVKRLTLDDRMDVGPAWTPDSRAIVFASDRNANSDVFEQAIGAADAQPLVTGPGEQFMPRVSPDGAWLLYADYTAGGKGGESCRLMRMLLASGPPTLVMDIQPVARFECAGADSAWVLSEIEKGRVVFTAFDPKRGRGRALGSAEAGLAARWGLSPDGRSVAVVDALDSIPRIRVVSFRDGSTREVRLDQNVGLADVSWAPDGVDWYVVSGGLRPWSVLRVTPDGKTTPLIPPQSWMYDCTASPDGRHVAYTSNTGEGSLWLLEDF